VRILGVAAERHAADKIAFPVVYNHGSRVLGMKTGDFVLLDASGTRRLAGTLNASENPLGKVRAELDKLGVRQ
jgi:hypothetical protein